MLDVAVASFLEQGYAATTMSGVAAQVGGSKATLWSYFPSKEHLFTAVLDRATDEFRQELSLILTADGPVDAALNQFCRQFLHKITQADAVALHRLVVGESSRFPELGQIFFERGPARIYAQLAEYLATAMERHALLAAPPEEAARQLVGMCLSGCHQEAVLGVIGRVDLQTIEEEVARAVQTFLRAYAP
ncbi:MAG: TetR/AcrR family transcriptional regulator [Novosphingobium sp.]